MKFIALLSTSILFSLLSNCLYQLKYIDRQDRTESTWTIEKETKKTK